MNYAELHKLYEKMMNGRSRQQDALNIEEFLSEVERLEEQELNNFFKQAEAKANALKGPADQGE